jgi:hypothetical protein
MRGQHSDGLFHCKRQTPRAAAERSSCSKDSHLKPHSLPSRFRLSPRLENRILLVAGWRNEICITSIRVGGCMGRALSLFAVGIFLLVSAVAVAAPDLPTADVLLRPGIKVTPKSGLCRWAWAAASTLFRVPPPARELDVVAANALKPLKKKEGKRIRIQEVFTEDQYVPAKFHEWSQYVTYRSVHGGPEMSHPPLVGAWYQTEHREPYEFIRKVSNAYKVQDRVIFHTAEGEALAVYRHEGSQTVEGFLHSVDPITGELKFRDANAKEYTYRPTKNALLLIEGLNP